MLTMIDVLLAVLVLVAIGFAIRYFVTTSRRFGGERIIICPETSKQAIVGVETRRAAWTSLFGQTDLRLENCSRWPMKQDCGQECLLQFDVAPDSCLVASVLEKWYRGKQCAFCKRWFREINLVDHKPALLNSEGITVEWRRIPITAVTEAMATYLPVCWNCHIAQTFHREHPDLVVDRPVH